MGEPRGFSWLVKSCIADSCREIARSPIATHHRHPNEFIPSSPPLPSSAPIFALPDDLLFECLSRLPLSSLPSLSLVCRRFALLLDNPAFHDLRRSRGRLRRTLFAISISDLGLITSASLPVPFPFPTPLNPFATPIPFPPDLPANAFSQPRLAAIGRAIYIIGRGATLRYDSLTGAVAFRAPTLFPRKKFAAAVVGCRIYVSGGATRTSAVEEYDPEADEWRVVAEAPRRRYGCVGAAAGGVFYVIGGLRVGSRREGEEAHACAGSMDAYHVRARVWLRVRGVVPGGGCVVGACGAGAHVYVLASHAVELSFWRWDGKGRRGGEWTRLEAPPVGGQLRLGGAVHFSCASIGDAKLAALVYASGSHGGEVGRRRRGVEAALLVYDIEADEWSRGMDLPPGLRRAACACVEC